MTAIEIKDLRKVYVRKKMPPVNALDGISVTINKGEFFALLGPNGAGKTTTINILAGLVNKTSGMAKIFGFDVEKDYQDARRMIGLVPQEFNFDIFATVQDTVLFQAGYYGIGKTEAMTRIEPLFKDLNLWDKRLSRNRELSGGMKRRVMIARALIHQPKLLILDEPTAGVDVELRRSMWQYLKRINKEGTTILLTTHYLEEAQELCERVAIINHGKIVALDKIKTLLEHKQKTKLEDVFIELTTGDKK